MSSSGQKSPTEKIWYFGRDLCYREMFRALRQYCGGDVLDVGGWDFFLTAKRKNIPFRSWTTLEVTPGKKPDIRDPNFAFVQGDGCRMQFEEGRFDTVVNIQVVEHVYEPIRMVNEIARVLKPGGHGIFLIPQTSTTHYAPNHYYNFTRFWIEEAMRGAGLEIVEIKALGGIWSSMASHLVFFFLQSARYEGMSPAWCKRNVFFYVLYPVMVLYALFSIPFCLFLSLGDLSEEPNNHLAVVKKR
jgi:SAM-dependent methyltransferase